MKTCRKCGTEITNGVNGCSFLGDICFKCNGGYPDYSRLKPITPESSEEECNYYEDLCLSMGEPCD